VTPAPAPSARTPIDARSALSLGLLLQCAAMAWQLYAAPGALNGALYLELGVPEARANALDRVAVFALPVLALLAWRRPGAALLAPIALWFAATAWAQVRLAGSAWADLAPYGQALRYGAPIALLALGWEAPRVTRALLGAAVATVFASHGWKAWCAAPEFHDLIWGVWARWIPLAAPGQALVDGALAAIAVQDFLLAAGALAVGLGWTPGPRAGRFLLYMALWGAITAASRPLAFGWAFADRALVRAMNALGPYALWRLTRP
jgi:hypothetical protein